MTTLGLRTCIAERDELRRENEVLRALAVELGGDPDVLDLRVPGRDEAPATPEGGGR